MTLGYKDVNFNPESSKKEQKKRASLETPENIVELRIRY
jgi:hypothetical protein